MKISEILKIELGVFEIELGSGLGSLDNSDPDKREILDFKNEIERKEEEILLEYSICKNLMAIRLLKDRIKGSKNEKN